MIKKDTIEKLSKKYSVSHEEFIRYASTLAIKEKKRKYQIEKFEILSRYGVSALKELENKIRDGEIPEHPAWEDLIEIKNIDAEIKEIENDIRNLQET
ncbi:MAG: hypothetical protein HY738_22715 [Bacteroidia bacterium]|nr:hypothetical protein [Bacteroidia bacterium]